MHGIIDISKVVGTVQISEHTHEVCAEADASFNRSTNELTVKLRSFLHSEEQTHVGETIGAAWLPEPSTVIEQGAGVDPERTRRMIIVEGGV